MVNILLQFSGLASDAVWPHSKCDLITLPHTHTHPKMSTHFIFKKRAVQQQFSGYSDKLNSSFLLRPYFQCLLARHWEPVRLTEVLWWCRKGNELPFCRSEYQTNRSHFNSSTDCSYIKHSWQELALTNSITKTNKQKKKKQCLC